MVYSVRSFSRDYPVHKICESSGTWNRNPGFTSGDTCYAHEHVLLAIADARVDYIQPRRMCLDHPFMQRYRQGSIIS